MAGRSLQMSRHVKALRAALAAGMYIFTLESNGGEIKCSSIFK